jgi:glycosyltransferase involved in cell wall biosynthesis
MLDSSHNAEVAILMCTYNGVRYLGEQLDSFARQTCDSWKLFVSDDGSSDGTLDMLRTHPQAGGRLEIFRGPGQGFAANFLSLACRPSVAARYYAFSDQDDVWHDDKLERALRWLREQPDAIPALYCSRTRHVDDAGHSLGLSPLCERPPSFRNALVQNIAGGNTMVFNGAAMQLLRRAPHATVMAHDWWIYILVTGAAGAVFYDREPSLDYRQHATNLIGGRVRLGKRVERLLAGQFRSWNARNLAALAAVHDTLAPGSRRVLEEFEAAHTGGFPARLLALRRSGVYRQTLAGTAALWAAALLGKV